jgi:hypothetical protein
MGKTAPVTFHKNGQILYLRKYFVEDDRFPFKDKEKLIATFDTNKKILIIEKTPQNKDKESHKNTSKGRV